jgi:twinkle protein
MGTVVSTSQCPECAKQGRDTKGDNLYTYDTGLVKCHACDIRFDDGEIVETPVDPNLAPPGAFKSVRGIPADVCRKYDYTIHDSGGHIAPYRRDGKVVYQSLRPPQGKNFFTKGTKTGIELFGQHLWNPDKFSEKTKKILVITEGELDCMAAHHMLSQGFPAPVVSVSNGVGNALSHIKDNFEWVDRWESVVLCFDMDDPGQKAAKAIAELFPNKAKIMSMPLKDACDMLQSRMSKEFVSAFYDAKMYRPDEIIHISEVEDSTEKLPVYPWAYDEITIKTIGVEGGELVIVGSGSGMGKSVFARGEMLSMLKNGLRVGAVMLEESPQNTRDELCGLLMGVPVRKILGQRQLLAIKPNLTFDTPDTLDDDALEECRTQLNKYPLFIHNHKGSLDSKNLVNKLRYLAVGCGCDVVFIDHISLVVAGGQGDERKDIDALMKSLVSLKEETGVIFFVVSQFSSPDGKPYEEGAATHLNSFRGSRSMGHAADIAIGVERNQQAETDQEKSLVTFRSLKARRSGYTGIMCKKYYNASAGGFTDQYEPPELFVPGATQEVLDV